MQTLLVGLALTLNVSLAEAQVQFTSPPPSPDPNPPRLHPSPSLSEDLRAIEALSILLKGRPAAERRHLRQSVPPPPWREARESAPPRPAPQQAGDGADRWHRWVDEEMDRTDRRQEARRARRSQRNIWDDLGSGRNNRWADDVDRIYERAERDLREREPIDPQDYYPEGEIEPGHIPYNCGHITNPRARRDCQENWQSQNPNDLLMYGR